MSFADLESLAPKVVPATELQQDLTAVAYSAAVEVIRLGSVITRKSVDAVLFGAAVSIARYADSKEIIMFATNVCLVFLFYITLPASFESHICGTRGYLTATARQKYGKKNILASVLSIPSYYYQSAP